MFCLGYSYCYCKKGLFSEHTWPGEQLGPYCLTQQFLLSLIPRCKRSSHSSSVLTVIHRLRAKEEFWKQFDLQLQAHVIFIYMAFVWKSNLFDSDVQRWRNEDREISLCVSLLFLWELYSELQSQLTIPFFSSISQLWHMSRWNGCVLCFLFMLSRWLSVLIMLMVTGEILSNSNNKKKCTAGKFVYFRCAWGALTATRRKTVPLCVLVCPFRTCFPST